MSQFSHAIVRLPGVNYADGLTRVDLGAPSLAKVMAQHERYCAVLRDCGLELTVLQADERYPDGTFVEDAAVLLPDAAMIARPGAKSRQGEVIAIDDALRGHYSDFERIESPGTLDGGDICEADRHVFIGLSHRTNEEGAAQLARWLEAHGYSSSTVDIRGMDSILHLKSGIAWLGDHRLLVIEELADHPAFAGIEQVVVEPDEMYAANAIRVNDHVLIARGYPKLQAQLESLGYDCVTLDMSEYAKMDGGLSCLSLRF